MYGAIRVDLLARNESEVRGLPGNGIAEQVRLRREDLPAECRRLREQLGVTAEQVAAEVGVNTTTVYDWELRRARPRRKNLLAWVKVIQEMRSLVAELGIE